MPSTPQIASHLPSPMTPDLRAGAVAQQRPANAENQAANDVAADAGGLDVHLGNHAQVMEQIVPKAEDNAGEKSIEKFHYFGPPL